jgi:excisionase family DNA binding protein
MRAALREPQGGEIPVGFAESRPFAHDLSIITMTIQLWRNAMTKKKDERSDILPMLKTVAQMSRISGLGENKLRTLIDNGELEFVQNGNRRLIADTAIWDWYSRAKRTKRHEAPEGG